MHWHDVWYNGIIRQPEQVRAYLITLSQFGRFGEYSTDEDEAGRTTPPDAELVRNQQLNGLSIYLNSNAAWMWASIFEIMFTIDHELFHFELMIEGRSVDDMREEIWADCFAERVLGWREPSSRCRWRVPGV